MDDRDAFLADIEDDKTRNLIDSLGPWPYNFTTLFPRTSGFRSRADVKRRVNYLLASEPRFELLLYPGERIEFVTHGVLCSFVEQLFMGFMSIFMNRTLFLMTNYRIILLSADRKYRPKHMQWQIPYENIDTVKPAGFISPAMRFKLTDRKKYVFSSVPAKDRAILKQYVPDQMQRISAEAFSFPNHVGRDPLCPACATPVAPKARQCDTCSEAFVNPMKPALMSLCLPCLGDIYLGHYGIALWELVGYLSSLLFLLNGAVLTRMAAWPGLLGFLLFVHVIDAVLTHHIASKGVMLQSNAWKRH